MPTKRERTTRPMWTALLGTFITLALPLSARATVFEIEFSAELTNRITVGTDVILDRTSAVGGFVYDDGGVDLIDQFPAGNPVVHLTNQRLLNGVDITDQILVFSPELAPEVWTVGLDNVPVVTNGATVTHFSIQVFLLGNADPRGTFDNPSFALQAIPTRRLGSISIFDPDGDAIWKTTALSETLGPVSWSFAVVPEPTSFALVTLGLGLGGVTMSARKRWRRPSTERRSRRIQG